MPYTLKAQILTAYCFLVYLFQLVPVIFTYLRAQSSRCRGFVSQRSTTGSRVKNPDPVQSLVGTTVIAVISCSRRGGKYVVRFGSRRQEFLATAGNLKKLNNIIIVISFVHKMCIVVRHCDR